MQDIKTHANTTTTAENDMMGGLDIQLASEQN